MMTDGTLDVTLPLDAMRAKGRCGRRQRLCASSADVAKPRRSAGTVNAEVVSRLGTIVGAARVGGL